MIEIARLNVPEAAFHVDDMRLLDLDETFDGIVAWNSAFHLTAQDQRKIFAIYRKHARPRAALMFTSGVSCGEALGEFEGEALYHASLDPDEYRALLAENGFKVIEHVIEDPTCSGHTVWLAQFAP